MVGCQDRVLRFDTLKSPLCFKRGAVRCNRLPKDQGSSIVPGRHEEYSTALAEQMERIRGTDCLPTSPSGSTVNNPRICFAGRRPVSSSKHVRRGQEVLAPCAVGLAYLTLAGVHGVFGLIGDTGWSLAISCCWVSMASNKSINPFDGYDWAAS